MSMPRRCRECRADKLEIKDNQHIANEIGLKQNLPEREHGAIEPMHGHMAQADAHTIHKDLRKAIRISECT